MIYSNIKLTKSNYIRGSKKVVTITNLGVKVGKTIIETNATVHLIEIIEN